jgi:hypothetical protein
LKRGTNKYKGKLPFKCFNCGKVGHFASKCPYARGSNSDEEEVPKKENKYQKRDKERNKGIFLKKKSLYSKDDSSSSDEDDDSDNDSRRVLFMALETQEETTENNEGDYEEEGEVNLEEELISALSDLRIERKKNKSLKEELSKLKEGFQNPRKNSEEAKKTIIDLRIQLEESKVIEETLKRQLEEKKKIIENLEAEIVSLRKELQKKDIQLNFGNSTKILDEIICNKKPFYDKSGLGYKQNNTDEGSSSMMIGNEAEKRSYADTIKGSIKKEECKPLKEDIQKPEIKKNQEEDHAFRGTWNQQPTMKKTQEEDHDFRRTTPTRRPPTPRYQNIFLGLCYSCNNFGHKAINCRAYAKGRNTWNKSSYENPKNHYEGNYPRKPHEAFDINYNNFGALGYEIECYKCNNFGHIAINCRSDLIVSSRETRHVPFNHIGEQ